MTKRTNGIIPRQHPGHTELAVDGNAASVSTDHHLHAVLFAAINLAQNEPIEVRFRGAGDTLKTTTHTPSADRVSVAQSAVEALQLLAAMLGIEPPIREE